MSIHSVTVSMCEHPGNRYEYLSKSGCRLCAALHSRDGRLGVIHFVVNNADSELYRTVNGVGAPTMVQTTASVLVVDMLRPVVHERGPLIVAPRISRYAILKKVTLATSREVAARCLHFNVPE